MAEGIELGDLGRPRDEDVDQPEDDESTAPFVDIPPADATAIHNAEAALEHLTGIPLPLRAESFWNPK